MIIINKFNFNIIKIRNRSTKNNNLNKKNKIY